MGVNESVSGCVFYMLAQHLSGGGGEGGVCSGINETGSSNEIPTVYNKVPIVCQESQMSSSMLLYS